MKTMEAIINMAGTPDWKELLPLSQAALHILLILVLAWMLLRLSAKAIWMLQVYSTHHTDNNLEGLKRIETLSRVFRYTSSVVIYVVAGMVILSGGHGNDRRRQMGSFCHHYSLPLQGAAARAMGPYAGNFCAC